MKVTASLEPLELQVEPPEHVTTEDDLADWLLTHHRDAVLRAMSVKFQKEEPEKSLPSPAFKREHTMEKRVEILDCIAQVQRMFLQRQPLDAVFQYLLSHLLRFQDSEYGYIGELEYDDQGEMYMTAYCRASSLTKQQCFDYFASPIMMRFYNWDNLFGASIVKKEIVIANDAPNDPRARGTPPGHPDIINFLGIPFFRGDQVTGMVGLSNRPGGYSQEDVDFLEPFLVTCNSVIQAYGQMKENDQLINTLERKVNERTIKLQKTNQELEAANKRVVKTSQAQLQHFACMSHEIRTPLNCIIGLSSLLSESKMTAMHEESIRMITASGDLLLTVVNDVLDYAKLESGNFEIEIRRSNLQEMLNAVIHSIQTKAASKQITIRTYYDPAVPEFVHSDCRRLQQILFNLLGNAIKFCPENAVVELGVLLSPEETTPREGEYYPFGTNDEQGSVDPKDPNKSPGTATRANLAAPPGMMRPLHKTKCFSGRSRTQEDGPIVLRFVVKDYGKGIATDDFSRIFEPFSQASTETERVYGGTGLGLAITAKLVNGLGGTISVASQEGCWSRFTVDVPLTDSPVSLTKSSDSVENATVFLVGEDCYDRAQVCHYFEEFGVAFQVFGSSQALDECIAQEGYLKRDHSYICLIDESCYDEDVYGLLVNLASAVLLTYGPNFRVSESEGHFYSLCQVLPSVLIKSMSSALRASRLGSKILTRQHSFSSQQVLYTDYHVLVAEDNRVNQKVLLRMLKRIGIERVHVVDNGARAVEAEEQGFYDIVLMDMQMPIMDGLEASRRITSRERTARSRQPHVIFVTAHVSPSFETACNEAGGSGFLSKPFSVPDLENTIRKAYEARQVPVEEDILAVQER
jgi:signal transduction histidine kinase/ActR/RegA family two-component response regulator